MSSNTSHKQSSSQDRLAIGLPACGFCASLSIAMALQPALSGKPIPHSLPYLLGILTSVLAAIAIGLWAIGNGKPATND